MDASVIHLVPNNHPKQHSPVTFDLSALKLWRSNPFYDLVVTFCQPLAAHFQRSKANAGVVKNSNRPRQVCGLRLHLRRPSAPRVARIRSIYPHSPLPCVGHSDFILESLLQSPFVLRGGPAYFGQLVAKEAALQTHNLGDRKAVTAANFSSKPHADLTAFFLSIIGHQRGQTVLATQHSTKKTHTNRANSLVSTLLARGTILSAVLCGVCRRHGRTHISARTASASQ